MGWATTAVGTDSTAMGKGTQASADNSLAIGKYNLGLNNTIFEIGVGA